MVSMTLNLIVLKGDCTGRYIMERVTIKLAPESVGHGYVFRLLDKDEYLSLVGNGYDAFEHKGKYFIFTERQYNHIFTGDIMNTHPLSGWYDICILVQ